jgi:hypothetical protein
MELRDLVGLHILSGVHIGHEGESEAISFIFDGRAYRAVADGKDDFHSCMREIKKVSIKTIKNSFQGIQVFAHMCGRRIWGECPEILEVYDVKTARIVLAVGTDNTYDEYPMWVAEFMPENMSLNMEGEQ